MGHLVRFCIDLHLCQILARLLRRLYERASPIVSMHLRNCCNEYITSAVALMTGCSRLVPMDCYVAEGSFEMLALNHAAISIAMNTDRSTFQRKYVARDMHTESLRACAARGGDGGQNRA